MAKTETTILVLGTNGQLARSFAGLADPRIKILGRPHIDLLEHETLRDKITSLAPELVINPAAYTQVDKAESEPELARKINADGAALLAGITAELGIPLLHFSTDYVFAGSKTSAYDEHDPCSPVTVYGQTKLAGERAIRATNPQHVILRTSWVFSPYGSNFVKTMLRLAGSHPKITVVSDQTGSPTYAPSLAKSAMKIADQMVGSNPANELWGTYHISGSGTTHWADFAREVFKHSARFDGPTAEVENVPGSAFPTLAKRPKNSVLAPQKLTRLLGEEQPPWTAGVKTCVQQLLQDQNQGGKL